MNSRIKQAMYTSPLFSGLGESDIDKLTSAASIRVYGKREALFMEGDPVESFYLVVSGQIKVYKLSADGKEHVLHLALPNQTFAEGAIFGFAGYPASAEAVESSEVIVIPKETFISLLDDDPKLCQRMLKEIAIWLRRMTDIIFSLAFKDVETRLVGYVVSQCHNEYQDVQNGMRFNLGIEKALLASYLGTIPETFSRALRKLQNNKLLSVDGPIVTILDAEKLLSMIEKD